MTPVPQNLADLRRAFYRLLGIGPLDGAVSEHDSSYQETVSYFIQYGLWDAQSFLLNNTPYNGWKKTITVGDGNSELTFEGSYKEGGLKAELPEDFLKAAGPEGRSPFISTEGRTWGREVDEEFYGQHGAGFYFDGDHIIMIRDKAPPDGTLFEYHYQHPVLEENTPIDFPRMERPLIPAEAAVRALTDSWLPDESGELTAKVYGHRRQIRERAASRLRASRRPAKFQAPRSRYGTQSFY